MKEVFEYSEARGHWICRTPVGAGLNEKDELGGKMGLISSRVKKDKRAGNLLAK